MGDVYRRSTVHLAAHRSRNSDDGFLKPRPKADYVSLPFSSKRLKVSGNMLVRTPLTSYRDSLSSHHHSVLSSRGWVFQETLLSPRTIHFSHEQLFWECPNMSIAEGEALKIPRYFGVDYPVNPLDLGFGKLFLIPTLADHGRNITADNSGATALTENDGVSMWYKRWYLIVANYSLRELTVATDILPALSGIASAFGSLVGGRYTAGLFLEDMACGLLWIPEETVGRETQRPSSYRAPTWSWASILGPVKFVIDLAKASSPAKLVPGQQQQVSILSATTHIPGRGSILTTTKDETHSSHYGAIAGAELLVEGYCRPYIDVRSSWRKCFNGNTETEIHFDVGGSHDIQGDGNKNSKEYELLQIAQWYVSYEFAEQSALCALILRPVSGQQKVYEWVGLVEISVWEDDLDEGVVTSGWERKRLILV